MTVTKLRRISGKSPSQILPTMQHFNKREAESLLDCAGSLSLPLQRSIILFSTTGHVQNDISSKIKIKIVKLIAEAMGLTFLKNRMYSLTNSYLLPLSTSVLIRSFLLHYFAQLKQTRYNPNSFALFLPKVMSLSLGIGFSRMKLIAL